VERDDIVVYEVMVDDLDRAWWSTYRAGLEQRFGQEEIAVRALAAEKL
jgi:streptogramin lyase